MDPTSQIDSILQRYSTSLDSSSDSDSSSQMDISTSAFNTNHDHDLQMQLILVALLSQAFTSMLRVFTSLHDELVSLQTLLERARRIAVTSYPCTSRAVESDADAAIVARAVTRALVKSFRDKAQMQALLSLTFCNREQLQEEMNKFEDTFEKLWTVVVLSDCLPEEE